MTLGIYIHISIMRRHGILDVHNSEHVMSEGARGGTGNECGEGDLKYRAALTMFVLYIGSLFSNL